MASNPLVIHYQEEHSGEEQEVLLKVLSRHRSTLDIQTIESTRIEEKSRVPNHCLNLKNEWAGTKITGLLVTSPKGTS